MLQAVQKIEMITLYIQSKLSFPFGVAKKLLKSYVDIESF